MTCRRGVVELACSKTCRHCFISVRYKGPSKLSPLSYLGQMLVHKNECSQIDIINKTLMFVRHGWVLVDVRQNQMTALSSQEFLH